MAAECIFNRMVEHLDAVFHALSDATRRSMLKQLSGGERTVTQLAEPFSISFAGASKHVKVLEKAGLVIRRVEGRQHYFRLQTNRLAEAHRWLSPYAVSVEAVRSKAVEASRRHSRVSHEVEDLAHDLLVSALSRDGLDADFLRKLPGAARKHAAFVARSAGRRRARETHVDEADEESSIDGAPLSTLSPSLQTTLRLLAAGLEKNELRYALGVTDDALRKRFQELRARAPIEKPEVTKAPSSRQLRRNQVGVLTQLNVEARVLAASDPDEHGLIFTEVLTNERRTATPGARKPSKGKTC